MPGGIVSRRTKPSGQSALHGVAGKSEWSGHVGSSRGTVPPCLQRASDFWKIVYMPSNAFRTAMAQILVEGGQPQANLHRADRAIGQARRPRLSPRRVAGMP